MTMTAAGMTTAMTTEVAGTAPAPADDPDRPLLEAVAQALARELIECTRISHEPTASGFITGFAVLLRDDAGTTAREHLYVETGRETDARPGVLRLVADDGAASVWLHPADPELPALPAATFAASAGVLLTRLGVAGGVGGVGEMQMLGYRAGKRAVLRIHTADDVVYLKVVRPDDAGPLAERHRLWAEHGVTVPRVLGWSPDGLVVLAPLPGVEALRRLDELDHGVFLEQLDGLVARLAEVPSASPARSSLAERLDWYAERMTVFAPEHATQIADVASQITGLLARAAPNPRPVTIHGDLHLAQVFVDATGQGITGILDIDTAGLGDPADDAAAIWAHLVAARRRVVPLADTLRSRWIREGDPSFAQRATAVAATHLLGHCLAGTLTPSASVTMAAELLRGA